MPSQNAMGSLAAMVVSVLSRRRKTVACPINENSCHSIYGSTRVAQATVDTGIVLPNINDKFSGTAPDAGAYEVGQTLPEYGPRLGRVFADGFEGN